MFNLQFNVKELNSCNANLFLCVDSIKYKDRVKLILILDHVFSKRQTADNLELNSSTPIYCRNKTGMTL